MAVTKLKTGHGVHERRDGAGALVALAELADMLREFNAEAREAADAAVDIAPFLEGLKAVERHIRALKPLDADGRECAARHYFAGVFAGACGDDSVIARGVSGSLA
ncbi:TPA: hypothetical protein QDB29_005836, partial [Burkholderia vietnamiensis]|nr:hypothetical protein [Burkholderia vietnamiensis]